MPIRVFDVLDAAGITKALSAFNGKECICYTLSDDGKWVTPMKADKENFFYVVYFSVE